jgi:hypothetical protein
MRPVPRDQDCNSDENFVEQSCSFFSRH